MRMSSVVRLGDIAESIDYGVTASASTRPVGPKFLRITDIQDGDVDWNSVPWCECDSRSRSEAQLQPGDIVFARTGATTGKSFLIRDCPADTVFASYLIRVRLGNIADPHFVSHFFQTPNYWAQIAKSTRGVAQPGVNATTLKDLKIPLPPLPEQRKIAEILDKADTLRAKRRAALAKLETLAQSLFLDMFGDPARNPKAWQRMELQELFDISRGGSPRPIDDFITEADDGINWILIGDATEGGKYITKTKKRIKPEGASRSRTVKPGDFLLTNLMSFGRPYIVKTSGCIHDGWLVLSPKMTDIEPDYFYALLGSPAIFAEFQRRAPGATVKNLNIELVRSVAVPVAPANKQKEFSHAISIIEQAKNLNNKSQLKFENLFSSLQYSAFHGDL